MGVQLAAENTQGSGCTAPRGVLILNADDWGRDEQTTNSIDACFDAQVISSASVMVFMQDSERAAEIARQRGLDCGLHLNFTTPFSARHCPPRLVEYQQKITRYLRSNRFAQVCFHPGLANAFSYVVSAQMDEFRRLYEAEPERIDGHHHMHLAANVMGQKLIPRGTIVRRNFSAEGSDQGWVNRQYRKWQDGAMARRYRVTDFFFSLPPLEPSRLERIFSFARESVVEVETHPVNAEEKRFLMSREFAQRTGGFGVAQSYSAAFRQRQACRFEGRL